MPIITDVLAIPSSFRALEDKVDGLNHRLVRLQRLVEDNVFGPYRIPYLHEDRKQGLLPLLDAVRTLQANMNALKDKVASLERTQIAYECTNCHRRMTREEAEEKVKEQMETAKAPRCKCGYEMDEVEVLDRERYQ